MVKSKISSPQKFVLNLSASLIIPSMPIVLMAFIFVSGKTGLNVILFSFKIGKGTDTTHLSAVNVLPSAHVTVTPASE